MTIIIVTLRAVYCVCVQSHMKCMHRPAAAMLHCQYCDFSTRHKTSLRGHVRTTHTHVGVRPYQCGYCE